LPVFLAIVLWLHQQPNLSTDQKRRNDFVLLVGLVQISAKHKQGFTTVISSLQGETSFFTVLISFRPPLSKIKGGLTKDDPQ
jgi:hypothetical protein